MRAPDSIPVLDRCPSPNPFNGASCKRRGCPGRSCGPMWARDQERRLRINLEHYNGPTWTIAITPPGQDRLPYACDRDHNHQDAGCQVRDDAGDEWAAELAANWKALREDARLAVWRALRMKPNLLVKVVEPQKRGVPHLHIVLGMGSEAEKIAAKRFRAELERRAPAHDFGFVQRQQRVQGARETSRYLVGYLLGRNSKRKATIRANISHPRMPRILVWVTPNLTRETRCTMRVLRYARWYLAACMGRASVVPRLYGQRALDVAHVVARLERQRGRQDEDDPPATLAAEAGCHLRTIQAMRRMYLQRVAA